jgi:hypothetical protein
MWISSALRVIEIRRQKWFKRGSDYWATHRTQLDNIFQVQLLQFFEQFHIIKVVKETVLNWSLEQRKKCWNSFDFGDKNICEFFEDTIRSGWSVIENINVIVDQSIYIENCRNYLSFWIFVIILEVKYSLFNLNKLGYKIGKNTTVDQSLAQSTYIKFRHNAKIIKTIFETKINVRIWIVIRRYYGTIRSDQLK